MGAPCSANNPAFLGQADTQGIKDKYIQVRDKGEELHEEVRPEVLGREFGPSAFEHEEALGRRFEEEKPFATEEVVAAVMDCA